DLQRAVRFVRGGASKYGIHADQIGGLGASSGGHLVSMLGVLDGTGDSDDPDAVNRLSSKLQCVVALFAPSDLKAVRTVRGGPTVALFVGARNLLTDQTPPTTLEYRRYAQASPFTYISQDDASFLLLHGDADEVVPFEQSQSMERALRNAGVPVK